MDYIVNVTCPYCGGKSEINCNGNKSVLSSDDKDNGMGLGTQWYVEFETYTCAFCKKEFRIEGTINEYPVETIESSDVMAVPLEEYQDDEV